MSFSSDNAPEEDHFVTPNYAKYSNLDSEKVDAYQNRSNIETNLMRSPHLLDAYTMRSLEEQKTKAIEYWTLWTKVLCIFQFIISCFMFVNKYWYASFIGIFIGPIGYYGISTSKNELLFVHMILTFLTIFKDLGVLVLLSLYAAHPAAEIISILAILLDMLLIEVLFLLRIFILCSLYHCIPRIIYIIQWKSL